LEGKSFVCPCFDQWFSIAASRGLSSMPQAFQQNSYIALNIG